MPDHEIPSFPADIVDLVERWNRRFKIDFFTVRAIIAHLSDTNTRTAPNAVCLHHVDTATIAALAGRERLVAFFHDDDDFFAPDLHARLAPTDVLLFDTCVFPLFRVHADLVTFARAEMAPPFVWGRRWDFLFRFHSNNYGVNGRICTESHLRGLKDHIQASAYADAQGFSERVFSTPISATVKTPASASMLPMIFANEDQLKAQFAIFIRRFSAPSLPPGHEWLTSPLSQTSRLLAAVFAGASVHPVADIGLAPNG